MERPVIPLAVVDDHTLVRGLLARTLNELPGYRVVLEAADGVEYLTAVRSGIEVAVAVVDLRMPRMDGFETIAWIRANTPGTRALALSVDMHEEFMERALRAGACGCASKNMDPEGFLDALNQVALFGRYQLPLQVMREQQLRAEVDRHRERFLGMLTERELEYLRLACHADELTNEQLADRMGVHRRTIDGYRESTFAKCGVKSRAGLVVLAYRWGLVS